MYMYELVITFNKSNPDEFFERLLKFFKIEGERIGDNLVNEPTKSFRLSNFQYSVERVKRESRTDNRELCLVIMEETDKNATALYFGELVTFIMSEEFRFGKNGELVIDTIEAAETISISDYVMMIRIQKATNNVK